MRSSKKVTYLLIVIVSFYLFASCTNKEKTQESNIDLFNSKKAGEVAESYLNHIKNNNIGEANSLCTDKLISENKEISTGISKIIAYEPDNFIESSGSAYVLFNVIRSSASEPKCDLDNYAIKVVKLGEDYKIDEIKSTNKRQLFVKGKALRMIGEDGGKSELIITLNNIPKDIYLSENNIMLYKEKVPNENFGVISLGYQGQRVAISTIGNNKSFISIAYVEESKETQGNASEEGTGEANPNSALTPDLEGLLDKPIAKKVIPLDIIDNIKINNLVFSREESYLIVDYLNSNSLNRLSVYDATKGEKVKLDFDEMFPEDKYSIILKDFKKDSFTIDVISNSDEGNIDDDIIGEYNVDIKGEEIKRNI